MSWSNKSLDEALVGQFLKELKLTSLDPVKEKSIMDGIRNFKSYQGIKSNKHRWIGSGPAVVAGLVIFAILCFPFVEKSASHRNVENVSTATNSGVDTSNVPEVPKNGWIKFTGPSGDANYIITNTEVKHIGGQIGVVSGATNGPSILSNVLPDGTPVYSLPGISPKKACVVRLSSGVFVLASAVNTNSK
jgi:hypothetical protein